MVQANKCPGLKNAGIQDMAGETECHIPGFTPIKKVEIETYSRMIAMNCFLGDFAVVLSVGLLAKTGMAAGL